MSEHAFRMGLADFIFYVEPMYYNTKYTCRDYLLQPHPGMVPDAVIEITREDLEAEKELTTEKWIFDEGIPAETVGAFCEKTAVFRKIGDFVSYRNASVFHGVLVELDGEGYLFTAKSGTGKSTHAFNWLKAFPEARIINGDKPILRIEGDRLVGYGTPWCGKEQLQINTKVPIKAVVLIERGEKNSIERRSELRMLPTWLMQTHRPKDTSAMERIMDTALQMMSRVDLFCLRCNMDVESALVARQGIERECRRQPLSAE